jgi:PadR family transcriptional regulator PadR
MSGDERWPAEWMRAVLLTSVLRIVAEGETYGYSIARRLEEGGLGTVKGGTLYPLLGRLQDDGLVTASWREGEGGPGRKFFVATPAGREALRERTERWHAFTGRVDALLQTTTEDGR